MKKLSLVLPVYNEADRIKSTIEKLKNGVDSFPYDLHEIIFVNDGSNDKTLSILKSQKESIESILEVNVQILSYKENKGRGYAVRLGGLNATGNYIIYTDSDFSIPLTNFSKFKEYLDKDFDLVFGSKKKPGAEALIKRGLIRKIVGYGHTLLASLVLGVFAWDYQGGFKVFSKSFVHEIFPKLEVKRWGFDMEVIFLAKRLGYLNKEVPVNWSHVENNSKVKLIRDIFRFIPEIFKIRFNWLVGHYHKKVASKIEQSIAYQLY